MVSEEPLDKFETAIKRLSDAVDFIKMQRDAAAETATILTETVDLLTAQLNLLDPGATIRSTYKESS